jgi:hypothetical protein
MSHISRSFIHHITLYPSVHKRYRLLGAFAKQGITTNGFVMSVCPHGTTRLLLERCLWNFIFLAFFENMSRCLTFHQNLRRTTGTLHTDRYIFITISRSVLRGMRNVLDKTCSEYQNAHFMHNNVFFFENRVVYEIMWKTFIEPGRPQWQCSACALQAG